MHFTKTISNLGLWVSFQQLQKKKYYVKTAGNSYGKYLSTYSIQFYIMDSINNRLNISSNILKIDVVENNKRVVLHYSFTWVLQCFISHF